MTLDELEATYKAARVREASAQRALQAALRELEVAEQAYAEGRALAQHGIQIGDVLEIEEARGASSITYRIRVGSVGVNRNGGLFYTGAIIRKDGQSGSRIGTTLNAHAYRQVEAHQERTPDS